jgi:hypothetical protein
MTIIKNHFEVFLVTSKKQGNQRCRRQFFKCTNQIQRNVLNCTQLSVPNSKNYQTRYVTLGS